MSDDAESEVRLDPREQHEEPSGVTHGLWWPFYVLECELRRAHGDDDDAGSILVKEFAVPGGYLVQLPAIATMLARTLNYDVLAAVPTLPHVALAKPAAR